MNPVDATSRLSSLARDLAAKPRNAMLALAQNYDDVISLGRGDPDLPTPAHIVAAGAAALEQGHTHYTSVDGLPELRQAIAGDLRRRVGVGVDPDGGVLVTCGCQEAIVLAALALWEPGSEVVISEPRYTTYDIAARLAGADLISVPRRADEGFRWAPDDVAVAIGPRTRSLVLVNPDNPTGAASSPEDLAALAELARRHDLIVISDEIYGRVLYDGRRHHSIAALPGMAERTVVIDGFSKAWAMTGWRVGYLAGPSELLRGMHTLKHTLTISTPAVSQWAAYAALTGPAGPLDEITATYARRREVLTDAFNAAGLPCRPPDGGCFLFADIRPTGLSSEAFARALLEQARVLVYPGSYFGAAGEGWVRASLFASEDRLREAAERMRRALPGVVGQGAP